MTEIIVIIILFLIIIFLLIRLFYVNTGLRKIRKNINDYRSEQLNTLIAETEEGSSLALLEKSVSSWVKERKEEMEKMQKMETYRREYLGNVSHELKTPIFNIQGYVTTLLDGGIDDPGVNRKYLEQAEKSVERMIRIVEDLEAIAQVETGELKPEFESFDLAAMVKDILEAQELAAKKQEIRLTFLQDESKSMPVLADRFWLRQVITNLVTNSIIYGKKGGETRIRLHDAGESVLIEIADTGIGISQEHLPRIFERFYRVDQSRSRDRGGTGLGLAIVKHILDIHNSVIEVISTENVGTVFSFKLKKG